MKVGIFLIVLGVALGIERGVLFGLQLADGLLVITTIVTLVLYSGVPLFFGIRRIRKVRG